MNDVRFTCTSIPAGKSGLLPADADGYFTLPVGAFNCFNSVGDWYPYEAARSLFECSSAFMRKISTGCLTGENGHPKKLPGMTDDEYLRRAMIVNEADECVQFKEIWLDFNSIKDASGRPVVAVMAKLTPWGVYAHVLAQALKLKGADVCFSVRAFTEDRMVGGVRNRNVAEILTWDRVGEPGVGTSRKFRSPTLESLHEEAVERDTVKRILTPVNGLAMESNAQATAQRVLSLFGVENINPKFTEWK